MSLKGSEQDEAEGFAEFDHSARMGVREFGIAAA
jgi:hypothetical protein